MENKTLSDGLQSEQIKRNTMYEQVCGIWKTVVDFRFKIFASFLTLTSLLTVGFVGTVGERKKTFLSVIFAFLGILITITMWIMEFRNRILYRQALHFGKELELGNRFSSGIMTLLVDSCVLNNG